MDFLAEAGRVEKLGKCYIQGGRKWTRNHGRLRRSSEKNREQRWVRVTEAKEEGHFHNEWVF